MVVVGERKFYSIAGACRFYDIDRSIVNFRISKGANMDEAFGIKPFVKEIYYKGREIKVNGRVFDSLVDVCKYYKISYPAVFNGLASGDSLEKVIGKILNEGVKNKNVI